MGLEQSGVQLIAQGASVYISDLKSATNATNTFVDTTEKGSGKVSAAGQVMIGALRKVGTIAVDAFADAAKATASFLKDSIDVAGDFESNFNRFKIAAGKGVDTAALERFKSLFIQLGRELPVSTNEVEQAATEMVSGGIDPAIVAGGALRQTLQFAAASGLSLADAASTSAKFLAGWTDSAATTEQKVAFLSESTDALTKAAAASSTTAGELRLGLFNVQGAAQALHAPFDDVVATLGLLAPAFESSAQAGTALNVFMTRLVPSTNPATDAMKALGIITAKNQNLFFDAKGGFLGMANAAQVLKEHMGGLTDEQKISTLHTLFGNDAMKVGNLLLQDGAKGLNDFIAKMQQQAGVQEAAKTAQEGYNVAVQNAKGSVEALQITLATRLLPVLTEVLNDHIAPAINTLTTFADKILGASDPVLAFASEIHQWDAPLGSIVFYLTELVRGGEGVNAWLKETPPLFQGLVGGVQSAIAEFSKLSSAFDTGGISGLIDQLLSDIGAALPGIESKLGEWGGALGGWILDALPTMLSNFAEMRGEMMAWVADSLPGWGDSLAKFAEPAAKWVLDAIPKVLDNLGTFAKQMIDQTLTYLPRCTATLVEFGVKAVSWIGERLPALGQELGKFYNGMVNWVVDSLPKWGSELADFGGKAIGWVLDALPGLGTNLGKFAGSMIGWVLQTTIDVTPKLATMALKFVEWVATDVIPKLPGALLAIGTGLYNFIAEVSKEVVPKLATMAVAFTNWVAVDVVPKLPGVLDTILKEISEWILDLEKDLAQKMHDVGAGIVDGIVSGVESAAGSLMRTLKNLAADALQAAKDALGISSPSTEFMPIGEFSVMGIMQGFQSTWPQLTSLVSDLGDDLVKQAADIASSVQDAIGDAFGSTASIDRQLAKNVDSVGKLDPKRQAGVQSQIDAAQQIALAMNDPKEAAAYFKMRSDQLIELGQLNDKINATTDATERARLVGQYQLINAAQQAEMKKFDISAAGQSGTDQLAQLIQGLLNGAKMPGILNDPTVAQIAHLLEGLTSPPASSMQMAAQGSTTNYYGNVGPQYSMPVYSNNSPGAIQQSWAVLQASMP